MLKSGKGATTRAPVGANKFSIYARIRVEDKLIKKILFRL